jgi:hypothetical protein
MIAYYADWTNPNIPDFLDWIDFAFAIPTQSFSLAWDDPDNAPARLSHLVSVAHQVGTKVKLSIGGWTGSRYVTRSELARTRRLPWRLVIFRLLFLRHRIGKSLSKIS